MNCLISVVMPLYNSEKYIDATIQSILKQTYKTWELVIVDDCSCDSGVEIVKRYQEKDKRIKLIQLSKNSGAAIARNKAIEYSTGKYIAFLDSDDLWYPKKLENQIRFMEKKHINFSCTYYETISQNGNKLNKTIMPPKKIDYKKLLTTNYIGCLTAMYNQETLGKIYMPLIRKRQDYGLWLRILKKEKYAYCLDEVLALYRVREKSISSNKINLLKYNWKLFREIEKLNFAKSIRYLLLNILIKLLK